MPPKVRELVADLEQRQGESPQFLRTHELPSLLQYPDNQVLMQSHTK
jgi:hypothetical protein